MAVLTHLVDGVDFGGVDGVISTEVELGGTYTVLSQSGTAEVAYSDSITGDGAVDSSEFGTFEVLYTAQDDGAEDVTVTETVTIIAEVGSNVDTNFDLGIEDRDTSDTSGTAYDALVDEAILGNSPAANSSAYFSELALDPYEVKHSK